MLRKTYPVTRMEDLPALLGRSHSAIKNRAAALHLRKNPDASMRRSWSPDDDAILRELYSDTPTVDLARRFDRSVSSVYQRIAKLGLSKSAAFVATAASGRILRDDHRGRTTQFKKGQVPANKGLRRPGFAPGRMKETQFKKGTLSGRAAAVVKSIGDERNSKDGYRERKINNDLPFQRRWRAVHLLVWEAANGPLPPGHALSFRNGNKQDIRLENLELLSRGELMLRNTVHNLPKPLAQTIQLLGALKNKIRRRTNEKQDRRSA